MDQSIEQALTSLLPALNGPLPLKLLELGTSMLAQSRTRASNLKAEEEIARAYVCANLACERCLGLLLLDNNEFTDVLMKAQAEVESSKD